MARAVLRLLREGCGTGARHVVNTGGATWSAFAQEIIRRTGTAATVTPCAGTDHPTRAARPRCNAPDNAEIPAAFVSMPPWQGALDRHLRVMKHTHRMTGTASETVGAKPARAAGRVEHQVPRAGDATASTVPPRQPGQEVARNAATIMSVRRSAATVHRVSPLATRPAGGIGTRVRRRPAVGPSGCGHADGGGHRGGDHGGRGRPPRQREDNILNLKFVSL